MIEGSLLHVLISHFYMSVYIVDIHKLFRKMIAVPFPSLPHPFTQPGCPSPFIQLPKSPTFTSELALR